MKQFKRAKVVILPTKNNHSQLEIDDLSINKLSFELKQYVCKNPQHLYIISDDEIKDGDWCYNNVSKTIFQADNQLLKLINDPNIILITNKKIIATTDTSLTTNSKYGIDSFNTKMFGGADEIIKFPSIWCLPQPSQAFIKKFVEEYNKGNIITEVMVEYVDNGEEDWIGDNYKGEPFWNEKLELDINLDNTINIKPIKDS